MRFFKEYIIIILIVIFVIFIEFITDGITNKSISDIRESIQDLEDSLETEDSKDKSKALCSSWKEEEKKLSYYMEHDELEKVGVLVDNIKSDIENDNQEDIHQELDEVKFLLEHIKEKQKLQLKNIF